MKKFLLLTLSVALVFAACKKDDDEPTPEPTPVNPNDTLPTIDSTQMALDSIQAALDSARAVINGYGYLKSYVDRSKFPNFKLTAAHDVSEFHNNTNGVFKMPKKPTSEFMGTYLHGIRNSNQAICLD